MTATHPTNTTAGTDAQLWRNWHDAVRQQQVDLALRGLYAQLDEAVQSRGPTCWISGRCCNFDAFGHRLYVTALEIAWVLNQRETQPAASTGSLKNIDLKDPCPFQVDKLCGVHTIRPLGCRVYFCQEGTQDWQHDLYERFLDQLRRLHDQLSLPYRYVEWRAGLREAVLNQPPR